MGRVAVLVASLLVVACDDLPAAQSGACGNKVVDPTEDCDTYAAAGTYCRPPGVEGQCRYACGLQADGMTYACPAGMGCGTDGTCRSAKGTFAAGTQPVSGTFSDLLVGDVDGDHRADVVAAEPSQFTTTFFDGTLTPTATVLTPRSATTPVHPLLQDISGDGLADLLAGASYGTLVNLGSTTRSFVPTACPSLAVSGLTNARLIVIKGLPQNPGQTAFVMGTFMGLSGIAVLEASGTGAVFAVMSQPPTAIAGPVVVGHLVENPALSPCGDIAFGYVGAGAVDVYDQACVPDGMGGAAWQQYAVPANVTLPSGGTLVRGPMLLDVNADGHLDLLVDASRCPGCDEVDVAYGVGDGTFHSDPLAIPPSSGDMKFSVYPLASARGRFDPAGALPLAMGDLNADGIPDQVTPVAVLVSKNASGSVTFKAAAENHGAPWTEAVIADFNHDGLPDVAAGSSSANDISFFQNAGGLLDPFVIPSRPVRHLTVGDFDGDLVNDLAVAEAATPGDALGDSVSVLFGNPVGAPNAPVSMGRFVSITQMASARGVDTFGILSGTSGLATISAPDDMTTYFGGFSGSGDRVLRSPLLMTSGNAGTGMTFNVASGFPMRYAYGHFSTATGPVELAAIDQQYFPVLPSAAHRAWFLPTDGLGRFASSGFGATDSLDQMTAFDWSHVALAAVDLEGSGTDQLLVMGPSATNPAQGVATTAHVIANPKTAGYRMFDLGAASPIASVGAVVWREETDVAGAQTGRVLVKDLDGDGRADVIAVGAVNGTPRAVVFWNDLGGKLGAMTTLPAADGRPVVDIAILDTGANTPAVAVLTDQTVSLVTAPMRTPATTTAFGVSRGQIIAAGDVDGDGVEDLVVSTPAGFSVYRQNPVRE